MTNMICIGCPNGCHLEVEFIDNKISVVGNKCPRGIPFAEKEMTAPTRSVTSTVATIFPQLPVVPVRTNGEIPKNKIMELIRLINTIKLDKPLSVGSVISHNVLNTGVDLIITTDMIRILKDTI